ncbi:MAG: hypothetical protein P8080_04675 [Gammaproteobacteria bacterium]
MRPTPQLVTVLLFCTAAFGPAQSAEAPSAARDLAWGEVLYEHFQDESFRALVRLAAAESRAELSHHAEDAALLRGGTYLAWGLRDRAESIFLSLLEQGTTPERRDQAWYWLARIRHERGEYADAYAALERIGDALPRAFDPDRNELTGRVLIALGRHDQAVSRLSTPDYPGAWRAFADFNMAVALSRAGQEEEAVAVLRRVGTAEASTEETRLLRDRANLALGLAYLEAGDPDSARLALDRVRLGGPFSGRALLAAGWAEAQRGRFRAALGPWRQLTATTEPDDARLEALLAVPWAWHQLNARGESVAGYEVAVAACEAETERLEAALAAAAGDGLLPMLREEDFSSNGPLGSYMHALAADYPFRTAMADLRDLDHMAENLSHWQRSLVAFRDMVDARRARYERVAPGVREAISADRIEELEAEYLRQQARVRQLTERPDPLALASPKQRDQQARIEAARARALSLPESSERAQALDRLRRLEGALAWRMHAAWPERLRALQKALSQSERLLAQARARHESVKAELAAAPATFTGYSVRIDAQADRVESLLSRVETARARRLGEIRVLLLDSLERRRQRVAGYLGEARFALAAAWDAAANGPVAESGSGAAQAPEASP